MSIIYTSFFAERRANRTPGGLDNGHAVQCSAGSENPLGGANSRSKDGAAASFHGCDGGHALMLALPTVSKVKVLMKYC